MSTTSPRSERDALQVVLDGLQFSGTHRDSEVSGTKNVEPTTVRFKVLENLSPSLVVVIRPTSAALESPSHSIFATQGERAVTRYPALCG